MCSVTIFFVSWRGRGQSFVLFASKIIGLSCNLNYRHDNLCASMTFVQDSFVSSWGVMWQEKKGKRLSSFKKVQYDNVWVQLGLHPERIALAMTFSSMLGAKSRRLRGWMFNLEFSHVTSARRSWWTWDGIRFNRLEQTRAKSGYKVRKLVNNINLSVYPKYDRKVPSSRLKFRTFAVSSAWHLRYFFCGTSSNFNAARKLQQN